MSELPVSTVYLLKRAELAVRGCIEAAFAEVQLTPSQYFLLLLVSFDEGSSSADLARTMGVLPQSMTELIAPLEKRGAIVRRPDSVDSRILRVELTAAGERLFAKATEIGKRLEQELLEGFAEQDIAGLNESFAALTANAEAHSYHPRVRRLTKDAKLKSRAAARRAAAGRRARG